MVNIVIPMAGAGSRFAMNHWCKPKPFIDVMGKPMIEWVIECLQLQYAHQPCVIFIVQSHMQPMLEEWLLGLYRKQWRWSIVTCDTLTEGAACSVMLASRLIDTHEPLLICNSDQWFEWPAQEFWAAWPTHMILCFHQPAELNDTKWSYVRRCNDGRVEVREKQVISSDATVGVYYWSSGHSFVAATREMIAANDRVNNEFYVAPVYNYTRGPVDLIHCTKFHGLGVPHDLVEFLSIQRSSPNGPRGLVFDLDGVLVESKDLHYQALRQALAKEDIVLEEEEHRLVYDGLSTRQKLTLLTRNRGLPEHRHHHVFAEKQRITLELTAQHVHVDPKLQATFAKLRADGHVIVVASNCIRASVDVLLKALGLVDLVDVTLSNQDVFKPKPFGDIYARAAVSLGCRPSDLVVFEDSPTGFEACIRAGCRLVKVDGPHQLSYEWIMEHVTDTKTDNQVQIVMPMAGLHMLTHTSPARPPHSIPWHLNDVGCEPLINHVTRNVMTNLGTTKANRRWIFIVIGECDDDHKSLLYKSTNWEPTIIATARYEQCGAVSTVLLCKDQYDMSAPLIVHDNRHIIESRDGIASIVGKNCLVVHDDISTKWSYAEVLPSTNKVIRVYEKEVVGMHACTGIYSFATALDFVEAAQKSMASDNRYKYYLSQLYNLVHNPVILNVERAHSLRTQDDLLKYTKRLTCDLTAIYEAIRPDCEYSPRSMHEKCRAAYVVASPTNWHSTPAFDSLFDLLSGLSGGQGGLYMTIIRMITWSSFDTYKIPDNYYMIVAAFIVNHLPRFSVYFHRIVVTNCAVIMLGTPSINLNGVREALRLYLQSVGYPVIERRPLNIVHMTLARFEPHERPKYAAVAVEATFGTLIVDQIHIGDLTRSAEASNTIRMSLL